MPDLLPLGLVFAACTGPGGPPTVAEVISARALQAHVSVLAHDDFAGRETGSPEIDRAATYIEQHFATAGLTPLPGDDDLRSGYILYHQGYDPAATTLAVTVHGQDVPARPLYDFRPFDFSRAGVAEGDVVFAGYGITSAAAGWDDYAGLDVRGKIVLVFRHHPDEGNDGGPFGPEGPPEALFVAKARQAASHGAVGTLVVTDPLHHDGAEDLRVDRNFALEPPQPAPSDTEEPELRAVQITRTLAERLVAPTALAELQRRVDGGTKPTSLPLTGVHVRMAVEPMMRAEPSTHHNVVGLIRGRSRPDEWVIVGAHYDHLGTFAGDGDTIYNGADDNASGTAGLLALAEAFGRRAEPPERSILFAAFSGEEKGLLGSRAFVREHGVDNVVFVLILDMIGRNPDQPVGAHGDGFGSGLTDLVGRAATAGGLERVQYDGKGYRGNSDYAPFYEQDVPFLHLFTGEHEDYHQVGDHADKLDYERMAAIVRTAFHVVDPIARAEQTPAFVLHVDWLGIEILGDRVTAVAPGRRGEQAGLAVGDRILAVGSAGRPQPLGAAFREVALDRPTALDVRRDGEPIPVWVMRPEPGFLGVTYEEVPAGPGLRPGESGVLLTTLVPTGPAAWSGLARGDVLLSISGEPVTTATLRGVVEEFGAGRTVDCLVARGEERVTIPVTLGKRP